MVVTVAAEGLDPPGLMVEIAGDLPVTLPAGSLVDDGPAEEGRVQDREHEAPARRSAAAMSARRRSTTGMSIKTMWATILSNRRRGQGRPRTRSCWSNLLGQPAVPAPKIKDLKPLHGPQPAPQEPVSAPVKAVGPARIGGGGSRPRSIAPAVATARRPPRISRPRDAGEPPGPGRSPSLASRGSSSRPASSVYGRHEAVDLPTPAGPHSYSAGRRQSVLTSGMMPGHATSRPCAWRRPA